MKKRIIITALSILLASSTVMPAYAAGSSFDLEYANVTQDQADQYRDAILAIEGETDRYDFIFKTVTDDFTIKGKGLQWVSVEDFQEGRIGCSQYTECIKLLCDIAGIECHKVSGWNGSGDDTINHIWNLVKINNEYYYSDAMRADNNHDYDESKLTKTLWPTFTCSAGQLWSADEYLEKDAGDYAKQKAADAAAVWVKSEDIDWSNPDKQYDEVIYITPQAENE